MRRNGKELNDYLARLIGFYKWLTNKNTDTEWEDWNASKPINLIKKKKNRRYSSYPQNDLWLGDELLLAIKYCDNIRDKVIQYRTN